MKINRTIEILSDLATDPLLTEEEKDACDMGRKAVKLFNTKGHRLTDYDLKLLLDAER